MNEASVAYLFIASIIYYLCFTGLLKSRNRWYNFYLSEVLGFGGLFFSAIFVFYGLHLLLGDYDNNIGATDKSIYLGVWSFQKIVSSAYISFVSNMPYLITAYGALGICLYYNKLRRQDGNLPSAGKGNAMLEDPIDDEEDDEVYNFYSPFDGNEYLVQTEIKIEVVYEEPDKRLVEKKMKIRIFWIDKAETNAIIVGNCCLTGEEVMVSSIKIKKCLDLETGKKIKSVVEFLQGKVA